MTRPRRPAPGALLRWTPVRLIEYPMETLLTYWGLLSGILVLAGVSRPTSLLALLPAWATPAWGWALTIAASTMAVGLARHAYGTILARGMQLLGAVCLCYAAALITVLGLSAVPTANLMLAIAGMSYLRAWWLRTRRKVLLDIEDAAQ